jgi:hypothetical protein
LVTQRENAVEVVREIGESCKFLNPSSITLEEIGEPGYFEIHIKCYIDDETWECLKALAKKHTLGIKVTDHLLVIYGPLGEKAGS